MKEMEGSILHTNSPALAILPYSDYFRALFMAGNTMLSNRIHGILLRPVNAELDDDHEC